MAKILYIEDERLLRTLFEKTMTLHGHETDSVETGVEGLAKYVVGEYDIVALDHRLPDTTGIDLARKILSMNADQPLLMVTGQGDERLAVEAMTLGMANYVVKDSSNVYLELIPSIVQELLRRADAREKTETYERQSRAREKRFKAILNALPSAVHEMDVRGRFVATNPACDELFPREAGEIVSLLEFCHPSDRPKVERALRDAAAGHQVTVDMTTLDNMRRLSCRISPMPRDETDLVRIVGITQDITDGFKMQLARDVALKEAVSANLAKSEFLAAMSHEFRTPLNAIMGFSDAVRRQAFGDVDVEAYQQYAQLIFDSGEEMMHRVNEILDMSAINAGSKQLSKVDVVLQPLLKDCIRRFEREAEAKGIKLETDMPDDQLSLSVDKSSLIQIVHNLLSNAIKFSLNGDTVQMQARENDERVELLITDSGIGIPADRLANVTEPFRRTDEDPYISNPGWGIGLSVVKNLIDAHDGVFDIQSVEGEGTTVRIAFPR